MRDVLIVGVNSDIGLALAERYLAMGARVTGTHRTPFEHPRILTLRLDFDYPNRDRSPGPWDTLVMCSGTMEPIGPFMEVDGGEWQRSIVVNALGPCCALQSFYPSRKPGASVAFFAGGGTNNPFRNYSAYCAAKLLLIKMVEILDDETDLKAFILGPGYVRTKIHHETIEAGERAGANLNRTLDLLETPGTPMQDIFDCLEWAVAQDRAVIGGRNISVVHDRWREAEFAAELRADPNRCKLRRA